MKRQGAEESFALLSSTHNKKAERLYDYNHPSKRQASLSQRKIYEDCKYDERRKPPFLKGRFGGNVNMIGGSADSLSLKPRVRL